MRLLPTKTIMGTVVKHSDGTLICQEEATKNRVGFSTARLLASSGVELCVESHTHYTTTTESRQAATALSGK